MKKFIYSTFLFAATALLLSSCSSQLSTVSITKRHYRSGYYVDMGTSKHKTEIAQRTKTSVIETTTPVTQAAAENNVSETTPVKVTATTIAPAIAAKKNKPNISKELTASAIKHSASGNLQHTVTPNTLTELKTIKAIGKSIAAENKSHSNGHSLVWTIIVVLLILCLLSLLIPGIGYLIWLFLVVALILILLRVLGMI